MEIIGVEKSTSGSIGETTTDGGLTTSGDAEQDYDLGHRRR